MNITINENDFKNFEQRKRARFINSLSGFKSANLIGTKSSTGQTNLCIISSAFHLGADPALMGFIIRPDVSSRHTLDYLRETKFCTLNHVNSEIFEQAHQTSARYDQDVSEFEACELTEEYISDFHAPFVKESKIKLGLELIREIKIEENDTHLMICAIKQVNLPEDCLKKDGFIDIEKAGSIAVSALDSYHTTEKLARLSYAKPDQDLKKID